MTQVLATADFDIEWRKYASGTVIDFADAGVIALLRSRKVIDARAVAVAAAITAGATQVVHTAGKPQNTRQVGYTEDPVSGAPTVLAPGLAAVNQSARLGRGGGRRAARIFYNRHSVVANDAAGRTHHMVVELPAQFDQIMLVAVNNQAAQVVNFQATICTMADLSNINNSVADNRWTSLVNWSANNGNSTIAQVPVSPGQVSGRDRKSYIVSEPISVSSVPKTDGVKGAYLGIRFFMRTDLPTYTVLGNGTTDLLSQWATRPSGKGTIICRSKVGQFVQNNSTVAGFDSVTNENTTPIAGVIALYRGRVVGVVRNGDSIADGRGNPVGEGFMWPACGAASDAEVTFVDSNMGCPGQPGAVFYQDMKDLFNSPVGKYLDASVLHSASPNDIAATITDADITAIRLRFNDALDFLERLGKVALPVTWAPSNTAIKNYGTTDALRVAYNAYVRSLPLAVIDIDAVLAGATVGGQVQMRDEYEDDGIHPNNPGNYAIVPSAAAQVRRLK